MAAQRGHCFVGRANWVVLYQLLDLEKESYKNRIFILSCLYQKFSDVYDFEKQCDTLPVEILCGSNTLCTHTHTHTHTHSFIHYVLPLRQVHTHFHNEFSLRVRSTVSSFKFQYPIFSLRSSSSCLRLLPHLPFLPFSLLSFL